MSFPTYTCPYCWGEVHESATVCMHCAKELTVFRSLAIQLKLLRNEVMQLQSEVKLQAQQFDNFVQAVSYRSDSHNEGTRNENELSHDDTYHPPQLSLIKLSLLCLSLGSRIGCFYLSMMPHLFNSGFGLFCGLPCPGISWPN